MFMYIYVCIWICLHASGGRCAKTEPSSYGSCETENKRCGSCILTTKRVTQTNYYDTGRNGKKTKISKVFKSVQIAFRAK